MGGMDDDLRRQMVLARDTEGLRELDEATPRLQRGAKFYLDAFLDLDTERHHGFAPMKIPRSAIVGYAEECEMVEGEKYEFVKIIRAVDDAHVERLTANAKNTSGPSE